MCFQTFDNAYVVRLRLKRTFLRHFPSNSTFFWILAIKLPSALYVITITGQKTDAWIVRLVNVLENCR